MPASAGFARSRHPPACNLVKERRSITPDTRCDWRATFGTDTQSWLNLQLSYDLKIAEAELKDRIEREVETMAA